MTDGCCPFVVLLTTAPAWRRRRLVSCTPVVAAGATPAISESWERTSAREQGCSGDDGRDLPFHGASPLRPGGADPSRPPAVLQRPPWSGARHGSPVVPGYLGLPTVCGSSPSQ